MLGMLGSSHAGERDAAALQAEAFRRKHRLTWAELLAPPPPPERPSWVPPEPQPWTPPPEPHQLDQRHSQHQRRARWSRSGGTIWPIAARSSHRSPLGCSEKSHTPSAVDPPPDRETVMGAIVFLFQVWLVRKVCGGGTKICTCFVDSS
jgi:hypothetical protein